MWLKISSCIDSSEETDRDKKQEVREKMDTFHKNVFLFQEDVWKLQRKCQEVIRVYMVHPLESHLFKLPVKCFSFGAKGKLCPDCNLGKGWGVNPSLRLISWGPRMSTGDIMNIWTDVEIFSCVLKCPNKLVTFDKKILTYCMPLGKRKFIFLFMKQ